MAAVIAAEPGVRARFNGPIATQPVIRGLGGDRVLVLEDGLRTGDIATTAPDHAVTIEPATADRIEVIRGPAGLLYGSNTLGGVVNVIREDVPRGRTKDERLETDTHRYLRVIATRATSAVVPVNAVIHIPDLARPQQAAHRMRTRTWILACAGITKRGAVVASGFLGRLQ